jgi:hypothetical protein
MIALHQNHLAKMRSPFTTKTYSGLRSYEVQFDKSQLPEPFQLNQSGKYGCPYVTGNRYRIAEGQLQIQPLTQTQTVVQLLKQALDQGEAEAMDSADWL